MTDLVNRVAQAIFETDWPKDTWERFLKHPKDSVRLRYIRMAEAAVETCAAEVENYPTVMDD